MIISGSIDDRYDEIMPYIELIGILLRSALQGLGYVCIDKTMKKIFIPTPLDEILNYCKDVTIMYLFMYFAIIWRKPITVTGETIVVVHIKLQLEVDG